VTGDTWQQIEKSSLFILILYSELEILYAWNYKIDIIDINGNAVSGNMALAKELGMSGVPGFIIGTIGTAGAEDSSRVTGISLVRGAVPFLLAISRKK